MLVTGRVHFTIEGQGMDELRMMEACPLLGV